MHPIIATDRYVGPHVSYLIREYRVTAYSQFLDAYRRCVCHALVKTIRPSHLRETQLIPIGSVSVLYAV
jgi:hypothetical protein